MLIIKNIMRLLPRFYFLLILASFVLSVYTPVAQAFIVKDIRVEGPEGVNRETVLNYLPVHVGQDFSASQSGDVIGALYGSGLFSNVSLSQQDGTLIVYVEPRAIISCVSITGNKTIPTDKINEVLKNVGLVSGQVFDHAILDQMVRSLRTEFDNLGKYNACVTPTVIHQPRNRVAIKIEISEGQSVVVKQITIIGNHAFSHWTLTRQLPITTPRPWCFFTHSDLYTPDRLTDTLEALRCFYLDRGYLRFKIDSAQATLSPDRKCVYLVIHVTEGCRYHISGYQLAGNLILPQDTLSHLIGLAPGCIFSKAAIGVATQGITHALGNLGYLFASVNVDPQIDDAAKTVYLTFFVDPGNRVYVRRINFIGNTKTEDVVLRRILPQMEGTLASTCKIEESERQLNLTGFLADPVHTETVPIPGMPDQVDLNYRLTESPSASATAGAGYGTQGYVINAGLNQPNFMGTGNSLGLNLATSRYSTSGSISYVNPYLTDDGISQGFTIYGQHTTPGRVNIVSYTTDVYGASVNYGIPVSANGDSIQVGIGYQNLYLNVGSNPSVQLFNFTHTYGTRFNQVLFNTGWSRNTLDRAIFPTCGLYQALSLQVALPGSSEHYVNYYKAAYNFNYYHPITHHFVFLAKGIAAYGAGLGATKGLPFFGNYFAGGIGSVGEVRGFTANSLGPRDYFVGSNGLFIGDPLGGNELVAGTLGIIFPNPVGEDKLRTMVFMDGGNVYSTKARVIGGTGAGPIRYSAGVAADWRVPIMNVFLEVCAAKALNPQPGDNLRLFDFSIGTTF